VKPNRNQQLIMLWTFALGVAVSYQPPRLTPVPILERLKDETGTGIMVVSTSPSNVKRYTESSSTTLYNWITHEYVTKEHRFTSGIVYDPDTDTMRIRDDPERTATSASALMRCSTISGAKNKRVRVVQTLDGEWWCWRLDGRRPVAKLDVSTEGPKFNKRSPSNLISQ
jgi:hypothetical protein